MCSNSKCGETVKLTSCAYKSVPDIVEDSPNEQDRFLLDQRYCVAKPSKVERLYWMSIEENCT